MDQYSGTSNLEIDAACYSSLAIPGCEPYRRQEYEIWIL